ncbi:MAG: prepilin peptidase [Gammaproteobacteria bacterium]|nr:prepilin peptidase [Gammaproteobacteria bacterium]
MFSNLAALPANYHIALAGIFGLLIGSFLNVVVYRYPLILKYQWSKQSFEWLNDKEYQEPEPDGIMRPASRCGNCGTAVRAWQNIPVISYLLLRGKCASCKQSIALRYPLVEILTGLLSALVMHHFGWGMQAAAGIILTWALVALSFIDFDHQLLPDEIVLPLVWLGLALSLVPVFAMPVDAIIGAMAGYLSLWLVFHLFKIATGKEGMGYGDFKLLAFLGAWFGWQLLPQIILVSTVLGSIAGLSLMLTGKLNREKPMPFGPYIALAGWCAMLWGNEINAMYLRSAGL